MVLIIDYGMGNLGSVKRALEECGAAEVVISHNESDFDICTHAILPGVGAFSDAMQNIKNAHLNQRIRRLALEEKIPFLGVCLGMQLLATTGNEYGVTQGLNIIPADVNPLQPLNGERIPHVGWNEIHIASGHPVFEGIPDKSDFYFVHSFHVSVKDSQYALATTPYCGSFASVIGNENVIGVQFHPEKSSFAGFRLLKNFLLL
jgi:glutamine amidotransferase